ncbi:PREDICTED: disintegrin and metalloproteinase domain-containing protein 20-like [Propithecus coquereli]|uniref:disintegrin and metalloproteinase domain-containing protein 20-like n=1 Tax=Propithecus coquereli TaxID=379532 RepID=UPI00063F7D8C|nr:PREDICTED: disintegrin and metalloproteinase domain-containing protein 20-like [Propithecus coquereli]
MAVGETLLYLRATLLLLWLEVPLPTYGHSQARPSQHFTSPEVVIPLRVISKGRGTKAPGWLSYSLRFGGQRHIVHMKVKKLLFSTHLPVFTYTEQDALVQDQPFIPDDCYYDGYVEGFPVSLVALSTCSGGFQGMLQINDLAYEIEPIRISATFEHLMYKIDSEDTQFPPMRCGLTEEKIARQLELQLSYNFTLKQSSYFGWWTHQRFLELAVVVDHGRYLFSESNVSVIQYQVFVTVNIVDALYEALNIDIILTGIEIWTEKNPFSTSGDLDRVVEEFGFWKYFNFDRRVHHDTVHLLIKELHGVKLGVAYVKGICQTPFNCGVDVFEDNSVVGFALVFAHELGHNLGMVHDTVWCLCGLEFCIMYAYRKSSTRFSNCSYAQYFDNSYDTGLCLHPPPYPENIFRLKFCGNLVVEEGEECDCGTVHQCAKDPCCLLNCTLTPGATCAFGRCCKDCKFMPSGTLCRQQVSECDLPEWCNGTSHQCPDDVYVQDGFSCSVNTYCYKKSCNNHDIQCKEIFGQDALSASQSCYKEINTQGNRFGHCGIVGTIYVRCLTADIMCGRVQCENVTEIPKLIDHTTVRQFHFNDTTCWGTDYHLGMSIPDVGQVKDGTACGPEKICINRKCASMVRLSPACQPETCNMRGVCNNKQHCHCDHGWAPPYCKYEGLGGSNDSGPPPGISTEVLNMKRNLSYISLLWLLPLMALFLFCFLVLCKKRKKTKEKVEENA